MAEDRERGVTIRSDAGGQADIRFGYGCLRRIGRRNDCRLGYRSVLDQRALQLEWADAVVGRLEHVVGLADEFRCPSASYIATSPVR